MKLWSMLLTALFALTLLSACGQKEEEASLEDSATSAEVAPAETQAAEEESTSSEPGGYVPTPDELIPPAEAEPAEGS